MIEKDITSVISKSLIIKKPIDLFNNAVINDIHMNTQKKIISFVRGLFSLFLIDKKINNKPIFIENRPL